MLPSGPRQTYPFISSVRPGSRELAREILASIKASAAKAEEVRTGMMTTGCDGQPLINPLDGTTCNGDGGQRVLFNPRTRQVFGTLGTPGRGLSKSATKHPAVCDVVMAKLRKRRRFTDDLGNVYGPDGEWLTYAGEIATLNADYIHRLATPRFYSTNGTFADPPLPKGTKEGYVEKITGVTRATLHYSSAAVGIWVPSGDDIAGATILTHSSDLNPPTPTTVLEDATFSGEYTGGLGAINFIVTMQTLGTPDKFQWGAYDNDLSVIHAGATNVSITGTAQLLDDGISVTFGATTGHSLTRTWPGPNTIPCEWFGSYYLHNSIVRYGVAVRGTITSATPCINGGFPNNNIILTTEDDLAGAHALVVRDADTLAELYRAAGHTGISSTSSEKWSFSANDEGKFFAQSYATPADQRKVLVVSVNPLTFVPTIDETITLEENERTAGSTFAVAMTV